MNKPTFPREINLNPKSGALLFNTEEKRVETQ